MGFLVPVQISLSALPKPPVSMPWPPFEAPPSRPGLQPSNHAQYMPVPCLPSPLILLVATAQPRFSRAHVGAYVPVYTPLVLEKCVLDNHPPPATLTVFYYQNQHKPTYDLPMYNPNIYKYIIFDKGRFIT
jgi:hypothetical protein